MVVLDVLLLFQLLKLFCSNSGAGTGGAALTASVGRVAA